MQDMNLLERMLEDLSQICETMSEATRNPPSRQGPRVLLMSNEGNSLENLASGGKPSKSRRPLGLHIPPMVLGMTRVDRLHVY